MVLLWPLLNATGLVSLLLGVHLIILCLLMFGVSFAVAIFYESISCCLNEMNTCDELKNEV